MTVLDDELLEAVAVGKRVCWAGEDVPFPHFTPAPALYDPESDFRLPADWHGTFDAVYLTERDLGTIKQWPLVLDEALRLLGDDGLLFVRFTDGPFTSIFSLMHLLHTWPGASVEMRSERTWKDTPQLYSFSFRVRRTRPRPDIRAVSFGVITDGRKPESVSRFVESVLRMKGLEEIESEVVVCGPPGCIDHLVIGADRTRLVCQPEEFADQGWITRKKNLVVEAATGDVVVVAHDRYELAPDFLVELLDFGADFSVLVCRQETMDGRRFPDWVSIGSQWGWAPVGMLPYGDWQPNGYVNGGVMIARRDVLLAHPWNELLFWNQAEDVELSRRFSSAGIVPRLARSVVTRTALSREDQMSAFELLPERQDAYTPPGSGPQYRLGSPVRPRGFGAVHEARAAGLALPAGWRPTENHPRWEGEGTPELALTVLPLDSPAPELELRLRLSESTPAGAVVAVRVNGHLLDALESDPEDLRLAWPAGLVPVAHTARIELLTAGDARIELAELVLDVPSSARQDPSARISWGLDRPESLPVHARCWGAPEDWGRWTVGDSAWLRLPVHPLRGDARLIADVMALVPRESGEQRVVVHVGGTPLDIWTFTRPMQTEPRTVHVPGRLLADGWLDLEFKIASPTSPAVAGLNPQDWRPLGLGLASLVLEPRRSRR